MIRIKDEKPIAKVTHFYGKIGVAAMKLLGTLKQGDKIRIVKKNGTSFTQEVQSMELEHEKITEAQVNDEIGLKVEQRVEEGCEVFKL